MGNRVANNVTGSINESKNPNAPPLMHPHNHKYTQQNLKQIRSNRTQTDKFKAASSNLKRRFIQLNNTHYGEHRKRKRVILGGQFSYFYLSALQPISCIVIFLKRNSLKSESI